MILTLYTKPACGLCDNMADTLSEAARGMAVTVNKVDITQDPALEAKYRYDIPVLCHGEEMLAKHRAHPRTLRKKLERLLEG